MECELACQTEDENRDAVKVGIGEEYSVSQGYLSASAG